MIVVDQPVLAAADAVSVSSGAEKKGDETV